MSGRIFLGAFALFFVNKIHYHFHSQNLEKTRAWGGQNGYKNWLCSLLWGSLFEDTFAVDFWINLERSDPQSTRHGAVETHVGPFFGKRAKRSILDEKCPQKGPQISIKTIKRVFKKKRQCLKGFFHFFGGFGAYRIWGLELFLAKKMTFFNTFFEARIWSWFLTICDPNLTIWGRI